MRICILVSLCLPAFAQTTTITGTIRADAVLATLAKGLNVTLDAEVAAAVKALVSDFKSELQAAGLLKPAPATKTA